MLVTLKEYARIHKLSYSAVRHAVSQKRFTPDTMENGRWYVDENKKWTGRNPNKVKKKRPKKSLSDKKLNEILQGKPISSTRVYNIWCGIKQRCYNPNRAHYDNYGGRGIIVCEEWKNDPVAFVKWAYANGYRDDLQIDRINNDGDYEPDNCQWVTAKENKKNRRGYRVRNKRRRSATAIRKELRKYGMAEDEIEKLIEAGIKRGSVFEK